LRQTIHSSLSSISCMWWGHQTSAITTLLGCTLGASKSQYGFFKCTWIYRLEMKDITMEFQYRIGGWKCYKLCV
jgi:hypothetical protein